MAERKVMMKGNSLTLTGQEIAVGSKAPDFTVLDADHKEVSLSDFAGMIKVISVAHSLDTSVCDLQLRRFNSEAAKLPGDAVVLNITMDLPFAIARFCTAASIDKAKVLSDHRHASFGTAFGVLIKEQRLLARSIFILDKDNVLQYKDIVPEQSKEPDYDKAMDAVRKIMGLAKAA
jgi:thiol peroxidase